MFLNIYLCSISKAKVNNIFDKTLKKRECLVLREKIVPNMHTRKNGNSLNFAKVRYFMVKENYPNQKTVAKLLKCSV